MTLPHVRREPRLSCSGVSVHFGGIAAVSDVDLDVPPGEIVGLVGPNGAGKSTLFGVISGLVRPSRGRVYLESRDITSARPQLRSALGLARTFQHPELFSDLTVREHLVLAHRVRHARARVWSDLFTLGSLHPVPASESGEVDALVEVLGLGPVADRPALGLPLGIARILELGRALASSPTVLLLDEPSSGLDSAETEGFEMALRRVSTEKGLSVLLVEHDVDLVMRLCSAVTVLDFGVKIASGSPDEVRADPGVRAAYLGQERGGDDGAGELPGQTAPVGQVRNAERASTPTRDGQTEIPALAVEELSVYYGDACALSRVSFEVSPGKVLAVLGTNGSGKSSLGRAVSGLVPPRSGRVTLGSDDITGWPPHRVRRAGVVYLPESRGLFRGLTVSDNLRMSAATIKGKRARKDAVERALDIFPALAARRRQQASSLSGGEQQMLSLARAVAAFPTLLIADEASLGLAPRLVDLVFESLARAREAGVTVVMIEQYVHRALELADDCIVLSHGELAWGGPASAAHGEVLVRYLGQAVTAAS